MNILLIAPGEPPKRAVIDGSLKSMQDTVGGLIQAIYPWDEPVALICDEEGKLKNYELNRALRDEDGKIYDVVAGTFLIVGLSEDSFTSLTDEQIQQFSEKFAVPEMFVRINETIVVLPVEDSDNEG